MNKPETPKRRITTDQCKDTGMAMVLILLIMYIFNKRPEMVVAAMVVLVINMTTPRLYRWPAVAWFGLSHLLGSVMSRVILALVFILVVTPMALLRRLAGKDTLRLRVFKAGTGSVFVERNHTFAAPDLEKPY